MTKRFVADESTKAELFDRLHELVRRVKEGTLDGRKTSYYIQWLIEGRDIVRSWRGPDEEDLLQMEMLHQIEENIRIGRHDILGLSESDYRDDLLKLRHVGLRQRLWSPTIVDPRIAIDTLARLTGVNLTGLDHLRLEDFPIGSSRETKPYLIWVAQTNADWEGLSVTELDDALKHGDGNGVPVLLSPREMLEYAFHHPSELPDPRATSVRRPMRMIAGTTIYSNEGKEFNAVTLIVRDGPKGDSMHIRHGVTETRNSLLPHYHKRLSA